MNITEKIAALPEWSYLSKDQNIHAAMTRLALARDWIADRPHTANCRIHGSFEVPPPCTCGRDALLASLEVPK